MMTTTITSRQPEPLADLILTDKLPMAGLHLIEASAGTGKTYNLQTLFLRLLLQPDSIPVQNILVVTFTRAAAKDLQDKLRRILQAAQAYCNGELPAAHPDFDRIDAIVHLVDPDATRQQDVRCRTALALLNFDLAAIQTIHAFCQRLLRRFAFACGQSLAPPEPTANNKKIVETLCQDWFRQHRYGSTQTPLPDAAADFTYQSLLALAGKAISKPLAQISTTNHALREATLTIREAYRVRSRTAREICFDDLLLNLHQALSDPIRGTALQNAIRQDYQAALIDEFQDTDPIQWEIFQLIFDPATTRLPCFIVGDPKQAIYAFRNGDIHTYLKAAENAENRYQLNKNYRSELNYIHAINHLFADGQQRTFEDERIVYAGDLDAKGLHDAQVLTVNGASDPQPLKIMQFGPEGKGDACAWTAAEIVRFLNDPAIAIAGRSPRPDDIAVLTRTNPEAGKVLQELTARGVPAVRLKGTSVWTAAEAGLLLELLTALAHPQDRSAVCSFLLTPWGAATPNQMLDLREDRPIRLPYPLLQQPLPDSAVTVTFADIMTAFATLHETWLQRSFSACTNQALAALHLPRRLLTQPEGEQALANLRQMLELTQQAISSQRKSPEEILDWLGQNINAGGDNADDTNARKAHDDDAVRILTIHASKGLEFPVVFIPELDKGGGGRNESIFEYHQPDGTLQIDTESKDLAENEQGQESLRRIYVALTRSVHRTVVFYTPAPGNNKASGKFSVLLQRWQARTPDPAASAIAWLTIEHPEQIPDLHWQHEPPPPLTPPPPQPYIDRRHGGSSFTGIAPTHAHTNKLTYETDSESAGDNDPVETTLSPRQEEIGTSIFTFPAGERTGTCWHDILEQMPFQATRPEITARCADSLAQYGFLTDNLQSTQRLEAVVTMLEQILSTALPQLAPDATPFALNQIPAERRFHEWPFIFATPDHATTAMLKNVIAADPAHRPFIDALPAGSWERPIPAGYLTGFVDLWFEHDQRFYLIDWKSNRRNATPEDFDPLGLHQEMSEGRYWLQYLLYSVALNQFLRENLPDYDYDRHFGGVYYLFLRGLNSTGRGIYAIRPERTLIENLGHLLFRPAPQHSTSALRNRP